MNVKQFEVVVWLFGMGVVFNKLQVVIKIRAYLQPHLINVDSELCSIFTVENCTDHVNMHKLVSNVNRSDQRSTLAVQTKHCVTKEKITSQFMRVRVE